MSDDARKAGEEAHLELLTDEGIRLLAAFRRVSDPATRATIIELTEKLAQAQPPKNGVA